MTQQAEEDFQNMHGKGLQIEQQMDEIIKPYLVRLRRYSELDDLKHAIDRSYDYRNISCRGRDYFKYFGNYSDEFTIRWENKKNENGEYSRTEFQKIMGIDPKDPSNKLKEYGDAIFYCFHNKMKKIIEWSLIDLHVFRKFINTFQERNISANSFSKIKQTPRGEKFQTFSILKMPIDNLVLASSHLKIKTVDPTKWLPRYL